jgi:Mn-dependent DtxR family transcriptional regulator
MLAAAIADGLVVHTSRRRFALTPAGIQRAIEVTRGQRLWEVFLTEYPDQAASVVNLASASVADFVPPATVEALTQRLREQGRWPEAEASA